jgi:ribosome-associated toxin RatA of RatAB toxin-antitoxin module
VNVASKINALYEARQEVLWYSPAEMYRLVTDIVAYPQFLPWCDKGEVLSQDAHGMTARVHLAFAGVHQAFTTRNEHVADQQVLMKLVDGPFSMLDGTWQFLPLGKAGQQACRIEFDLRYAFSSRALELVLSPVFDKVANTFVDSFVTRAEKVYGER